MKNQKLWITLLLASSIQVSAADDMDINEGHFYQEEMEERIKAQRLNEILKENSYKVWSNCFSDNYANEDDDQDGLLKQDTDP